MAAFVGGDSVWRPTPMGGAWNGDAREWDFGAGGGPVAMAQLPRIAALLGWQWRHELEGLSELKR